MWCSYEHWGSWLVTLHNHCHSSEMSISSLWSRGYIPSRPMDLWMSVVSRCLSWGDLWWLVYSLILWFMPQSGCYIFKVWPVEGRDLGSLVAFPKPLSPGIRDAVRSGFCLVGLVLLAQATFSLPWPCRSCSSNAAATFWRDSLLETRENGTCGRGVGQDWQERGCSVPPPNLGKAEPVRESPPRGSKPNRFVWCGEGVKARDSSDFHLLPEMLREAPGVFFPWDRHRCHLLLPGMSWYFFPRILGFCPGVRGGRVRFNIWQFKI